MRIAQVAPLFESVPPALYGGTERVVSYLTEELVRQGHEVTLFASGDSVTKARLIAGCPRALRLEKTCSDPLTHHILLLEMVARRAAEFDVIHYHCDFMHFPMSRRLGVPHVTTLHGRLDLPELAPLYREFDDMPVVSISDAQREPLPFAAWRATVYHGLPEGLYAAGPGKGGYLALIGRISPEKGVEEAIRLARTVEIPLRIAAKVDRVDEEYFREKIKPLLKGPHVEFIGEIGEREKREFLGNALALVFPINWREPFGLVLIEAMACGTPVVARRRGSVPEVLENGVTGFVCDTFEEELRALVRIASLDRARVRRGFERRFLASRMASDYLRVYRDLPGARREPLP